MLSGLQIIHDINSLFTVISGDYIKDVLEVLKACSTEVLDLVQKSILQAGISLKDLVPRVISAITEVLVEKSVEVSFIFDQGFFPLLARVCD